MRIIAGSFRHRLLKRPPESTTRPTTDRVRESIFNILTHKFNLDFENINILDAFAGSGAMGLEGLSRGAQHVCFVEKDLKASRILEENISSLKAENKTTVYKNDILNLRTTYETIGLIFLDPPYQSPILEPSCVHLKKTNWIQQDTLVCLESSVNKIPEKIAGLNLIEKRIYGQSGVSFWLESEN